MKKNLSFLFLAALLIGLVYGMYKKPRKVECAYPTYFAELNSALRQSRNGASTGIVDLDRLDNNINVVRRLLGKNFNLRIVTKSLPSPDMLRYIMEKGKTNKLMMFNEPFISEMLITQPADSLDILLGKPLPVEAFTRLSVNNGWRYIHWLIDTKERLQEYLAFAKQSNTRINVNLEIDVGLHRGGFETLEAFEEAVKVVKANEQYLRLTGLMGYDGHVPFVPFYINKEKAMAKAFDDVQKSYGEFVDVVKQYYDAEDVASMTFNSGGSRTYFRYGKIDYQTQINDIAMGSGFMAPAQFPEMIEIGHQPVLYLSSPILKKLDAAELPHAEKLSSLVSWWNPNLKVSYFMLGGGWPGELAAPEGIQRNPFWDENDKGFSNMLPNQSTLSSSDENNLQVGDFVFTHPWEGDGMLVFGTLSLYRDGNIVGQWKTYKGGN